MCLGRSRAVPKSVERATARGTVVPCARYPKGQRVGGGARGPEAQKYQG